MAPALKKKKKTTLHRLDCQRGLKWPWAVWWQRGPSGSYREFTYIISNTLTSETHKKWFQLQIIYILIYKHRHRGIDMHRCKTQVYTYNWKLRRDTQNKQTTLKNTGVIPHTDKYSFWNNQMLHFMKRNCLKITRTLILSAPYTILFWSQGQKTLTEVGKREEPTGKTFFIF